MDESVNEGLEEIRNMIMALTELIKSVPMLEIKIENIEEKVNTLSISMEQERSVGNLSEEVKTAVSEGISLYTEPLESMLTSIQVQLQSSEKIINERFQELYAMVNELNAREHERDGIDSGELIKKVDDLCHLTLGQYDELKSIISDVELNLQSKYQSLHRTINKDG